jgi:hypothetical protein
MSYRNPKQFIDTQSGQHYMNLIKTISKAGSDYTKTVVARNKEIADRNNKIISEANEKEQAILNQYGNVTAGNPSFDYGEGFNKYIDSYSDLSISVETGTNENPSAAKKRMAEIMNLPTMAKQGLQGLLDMAEEFGERVNSAGKLGGLDLAGIKEQDLKALLTLSDQLKGVRSFDVVEKDGKLEPVYVLGDRKYTYTEIQNYLQGPLSGGVFNSIPNETEDWTKAAELAMITDPNNVDKKVLDPKYYENQPEETRQDDKGNTIIFKSVNRDMLKQSPVGQSLYADADSLSNADKISLYNNIVSKDDNFEYGKVLNAEEEKKFRDAYVDYALDNYVQQQHQVGFVKQRELTESEIKTGKAAKESKTNYDIAKKLINQEGKIPDVPAQPNFFGVSGQLTSEGNRFKEAVSTIVTGSNGKLVEFVESERTGEPSAKVKYPGQPEVEISLAEFRNKDLFDAKIQKATGAGTSGLETYYDINLD